VFFKGAVFEVQVANREEKYNCGILVEQYWVEQYWWNNIEWKTGLGLNGENPGPHCIYPLQIPHLIKIGCIFGQKPGYSTECLNHSTVPYTNFTQWVSSRSAQSRCLYSDDSVRHRTVPRTWSLVWTFQSEKPVTWLASSELLETGTIIVLCGNIKWNFMSGWECKR
jgi:hypothetical protein